jgi:hypothetical protein
MRAGAEATKRSHEAPKDEDAEWRKVEGKRWRIDAEHGAASRRVEIGRKSLCLLRNGCLEDLEEEFRLFADFEATARRPWKQRLAEHDVS